MYVYCVSVSLYLGVLSLGIVITNDIAFVYVYNVFPVQNGLYEVFVRGVWAVAVPYAHVSLVCIDGLKKKRE